MKKILSVILILALLSGLAACGAAPQVPTAAETAPSTTGNGYSVSDPFI